MLCKLFYIPRTILQLLTLRKSLISKTLDIFFFYYLQCILYRVMSTTDRIDENKIL